ncbi:MAG: putative hydrolase [Actinomycetia bacterium]|nr:putative hydrolase [Actinomycetes bacterium]
MPETIATDGVKIAYDAFGRRDGEPLVLIQGLGLDSRGWTLQRMVLGRHFRCYAIDNRGVGRSGRPPGPYDLSQMARDVISVMDAEGHARAHVLGASMGGIIAQILAVQHPARVRGLVLACTACQHHPWRRELLAEWADAVREHGMSALSDDALRWMIGPRFRRRFGLWLNVLAHIVLSSPPEPFIAQVEAVLAEPDEKRFELRGVRVPTLIVTGSQDALTPVGDAEELAELIPGSELCLLSGAAHGLMVESPNAFNAIVVEFLLRHPDGAWAVDDDDLREPGEAASA